LGLNGTYKLIPFGLIASFILFFRLKNIQISKDFREREKQKGNMETFKNVLPLFITITGIIFFIAVMQGSLTAFLPTYITEKGKSLWIGGFSLSGLELAGAAGTFLSGTISDKIGRRNTLLIIAVVSPALMWLFILSNNLLAIFFLIVLGIFLFGTTPILLAIVNDNASEQPSFINGIYMTINFIIGGASIFLVGLLGDLVGLDITYKITATLALLSIPFILRLPAQNQTHSK
jgi:FSR family fosmidomycin resistance protein-like MFS transporter